MDDIVAVVPARGGSKRLVGKNIKNLAGKPLIFHTIDALIGHDRISKIVFSSDEEAYIDLVKRKYKHRVDCVARPKAFATDTTKVFDEMLRLAKQGTLDKDWFLLCLPTSPFRDFQTIKSVIARWEKDGNSMFGATHYTFPIQFAFEIDGNGDWVPKLGLASPMLTGNTRSQDLSKTYRPNGAFYLQRVEALFDQNTFYVNSKPWLMNETESLDIDNEICFGGQDCAIDDGNR